MFVNSNDREEYSEYTENVKINSHKLVVLDHQEVEEYEPKEKQVAQGMDTFGNKNQFMFQPDKNKKRILNQEERENEKQDEQVADSMDMVDGQSEDFMSFGHSVSTTKVYNNVAKMFTQLQKDVANPVLLSALVIIEEHDILVTGGSNDKTLRFWSIVSDDSRYDLELEHELKIFSKSATNVRYIPERRLILAGDSISLFIFDMEKFFGDHNQKPQLIVHLHHIHWLRCMYHYKINPNDWLITAKGLQIFYFDLATLTQISIKKEIDLFKEKIMCFEEMDDSHILVGNGKSISFWDVKNGKIVGITASDHEKFINNILHIKKRRIVLSGGDDGFVFVYKLNAKEKVLNIMQKISPSGSTTKSFIDSLVYFEEQSMLFCTNRTKNLTIFCFNSDNILKEKSKITDLKFKVTGLYFWKRKVSLLAYSSLEPQIIILGFAGVNISN